MSIAREDIKPETAAKIAAQAKTKGLSIDEYLRSLLSDEPDQTAASNLSPADKVRRWREWIRDNSVKNIIPNDSRESIYTREDEAL